MCEPPNCLNCAKCQDCLDCCEKNHNAIYCYLHCSGNCVQKKLSTNQYTQSKNVNINFPFLFILCILLILFACYKLNLIII